MISKPSWEDFSEAFYDDFWGERIPKDMEHAQCMRALFDEKGFVSVNGFGRILGFLGPLRCALGAFLLRRGTLTHKK